MDLSGTQAAASAGTGSTHLLERIEQWLAKRWVLTLINLSVLALLSFSLARGVWRLFTPTAPVAAPAVSMATGDATGEYNLQALLSANLFGHAASKGPTSLESIPLSSLNLVLTGVMVTPASSYALISADGSPELPFGLNQEIVSGVTLYAVYSDRVLIRRGAATESLMLKDSGASLPDGSIVMGGGQARSPGNYSQVVSRERLTRDMQRPDFLTQALMIPDASGGFVVREIQPGSTYEQLGLQVGDVIKSVNGQAVNTIEDVMRLYQQFETTGNVELSVRRGGQTVSLNYNIQ